MEFSPKASGPARTIFAVEIQFSIEVSNLAPQVRCGNLAHTLVERCQEKSCQPLVSSKVLPWYEYPWPEHIFCAPPNSAWYQAGQGVGLCLPWVGNFPCVDHSDASQPPIRSTNIFCTPDSRAGRDSQWGKVGSIPRFPNPLPCIPVLGNTWKVEDKS